MAGEETAGKAKRNIRLSYIYTVLMNTALDRGIWMLFLGFRGMSLVEIGLIESVFQFSCLLFGVPAGAIADILGRRTSLVLSVVLKVISYIILLLSHDFAGFAFSFGLSAISLVLYNGASESMIYDSYKASKKDLDYKKVYGSVIALTFVSAAIGVAAGGFIASASYEWVYYISIIVLLAALVPALLFSETAVKGENKNRKKVTVLVKDSVSVVARTPLLVYLLLLYGALTIVDVTIYMYCQKYFQMMSIPVYAIGLILSLDSIVAAGGAKLSSLFDHIKTKDALVVIPVMIIASYILLALLNNVLSVLFLFVATVFIVAFWPILSELINTRVPSENRATVLSFKGQLYNGGVMIVFPLVGLLAEGTSLSLAFLCLIALAIPVVAFAVIGIRRSAF